MRPWQCSCTVTDVLANFEMAPSWPELIKRTARDSMADDAQGLVRLTAITLTVVLSLFVAFAFGLIVAGPEVADALAARFSFGQVFVWSWKIVQWPIAFGLVMVGIGLIYYFAPDAEQSWVWITPGTLVATVLWLLGSLLFRYYTTSVTNYAATYGAIGGVIVLMLWFYLSGLSIVIGAEMNAEIEHASPWGKAPGERVAGRRKQIGLAAARAYRERAASAGERAAPIPRAAIMPDLAHTPATPFEKAVAPIALFIWRSRTKE